LRERWDGGTLPFVTLSLAKAKCGLEELFLRGCAWRNAGREKLMIIDRRLGLFKLE